MGMEIQSLTTHWWLLGLAVLACVLTFISPWAFTLQLVLLAVAIYLLTRGPTRAQAVVLTIAIVMLAIVMAAIATSTIVIYNLDSEFGGKSVPIEAP